MKAPLSWLKDYVDIDVSANELAEKLFSCGFEVEELVYLGEKIAEKISMVWMRRIAAAVFVTLAVLTYFG